MGAAMPLQIWEDIGVVGVREGRNVGKNLIVELGIDRSGIFGQSPCGDGQPGPRAERPMGLG